MQITMMKCVRCNGSGSANPLTWPGQGHKGGCGLCGGKGTKKVEVYEPEEHRRRFGLGISSHIDVPLQSSTHHPSNHAHDN